MLKQDKRVGGGGGHKSRKVQAVRPIIKQSSFFTSRNCITSNYEHVNNSDVEREERGERDRSLSRTLVNNALRLRTRAPESYGTSTQDVRYTVRVYIPHIIYHYHKVPYKIVNFSNSVPISKPRYPRASTLCYRQTESV